METKNILHDIAKRCDGDIYLGVVGPVRSGKSSFIKRFILLKSFFTLSPLENILE